MSCSSIKDLAGKVEEISASWLGERVSMVYESFGSFKMGISAPKPCGGQKEDNKSASAARSI